MVIESNHINTDIEDESKGLVIRRREAAPGNKIVIRLSPDVPRDTDLYDLMRKGLVVELIDIEQEGDGDPIATIGIKAEEAFRIDRDERILRPRPEKERARLPDARVPLPDRAKMVRWSIEDHDNYICALTECQQRIRGYIGLSKHDLMIASERGWNIRHNDGHMDWLMIREEILVLKEQLSGV